MVIEARVALMSSATSGPSLRCAAEAAMAVALSMKRLLCPNQPPPATEAPTGSSLSDWAEERVSMNSRDLCAAARPGLSAYIAPRRCVLVPPFGMASNLLRGCNPAALEYEPQWPLRCFAPWPTLALILE